MNYIPNDFELNDHGTELVDEALFEWDLFRDGFDYYLDRLKKLPKDNLNSIKLLYDGGLYYMDFDRAPDPIKLFGEAALETFEYFRVYGCTEKANMLLDAIESIDCFVFHCNQMETARCKAIFKKEEYDLEKIKNWLGWIAEELPLMDRVVDAAVFCAKYLCEVRQDWRDYAYNLPKAGDNLLRIHPINKGNLLWMK